jgi:hypothetical protein
MPNALFAQYTASMLGGDKLSVGLVETALPAPDFRRSAKYKWSAEQPLALVFFRLGLNNAGMRRRVR